MKIKLSTKVSRVFVTSALLLTLGACGNGQGAFRVVQFCVHDRPGAEHLVTELKQLAATEHMEFSDRSEAAEKEATAIGRGRSDGSSRIAVSLIRMDGLGVGGGNLGLPGYQVTLGFSRGSDFGEATRFADRVVEQLNRQWRVDVLAPGANVPPMSGCR
jgi:hypothetical protein